MNSGSSNDEPVLETESFEDISSGGPPSPFLNLNAARAMRGNDFSNTVFIDDSSPSDDNISAARNDFSPPDRKEPTCNNGEKVIQSTFPIGSSSNLHVISDHGLLGSGSIPVPDVDGGNCPSSSRTPALPSKRARLRIFAECRDGILYSFYEFCSSTKRGSSPTFFGEWR
ncbi:hypothetical protein MKW98_014533 [Papaver atlanticum]|uniref:Uncharacterized protein n=1 Tax=Papaver atlanticum TaxID=357466 RepID=A0AAD4SL30_9MAGN|nr:hypothetical protein MKW98_014533 [Papaver atlanticum]